MNQLPLVHDGQARIWPRYRLPDSRAINAAPWADALSRSEPVGTCSCGAYLKPDRPYRVDRIDWYPARCSTPTGCGYETAAAGPRPKTKPRRNR